ncbi:MAG: AraC family transcriptional regulator, partial [Brachybacterium sp.]|nr:AraC family transcriptional regulator [Brachybacterium sp.]
MPTFRHRIPPVLTPYLRSCIGYEYCAEPTVMHHGLPSPGITAIIAFDAPLDCAWMDDADRARFDTLLAGLHTAPTLIRTHGRQHGIHLSLTPLGVRALFAAPAGAFAHTLIDGDDASRIPSALQRRLQDATWPDRFRM